MDSREVPVLEVPVTRLGNLAVIFRICFRNLEAIDVRRMTGRAHHC